MINLIPMPLSITESFEVYGFEKKNATVFISKELEEIYDILPVMLDCEFGKAKENADISFIYDSAEEKEGYSLKINEKGARIFASAYEGAFYALQTLRQLFESDIKNKKMLSARYVTITNDSPRYEWRGLQLDESRHFFGKATVKKLLDFMAMYKLNVFHWHLTDDQGWRIEIEKYPLLTEIGSKRPGSQIKNWKSTEYDYTPVEGYYTKEDIKEIVEYAKKRCINIVPEIDFPAHSAAAIASYNYLACREIPCEVADFFGGIIPEKRGEKNWNRPLCLGKEEVYRFVCDVIDEVSELFPFPYFHVGGDEAPTNEWKKCSCCQKKMEEEGLKNETELQGYFTNRVNEYLKSKGKIMIGWNEVLKAKLLNRDVVAQYWTPGKDANVTKHLKEGGKVILSCHKYFYFDMLHTYATVKNAYTFNPLENNVPKSCMPSVLGIECENWTEWTNSEDELFFKLYHRAIAMAENAWSDEEAKDYKDFARRIQRHKYYADELGFYYGLDEVVMEKNELMKNKVIKKLGISFKDFDCEYKVNKYLEK